MKKVNKKFYILTLFFAFSVAGYISISKYISSNDFLVECIYNVLSFIVVSLPILAVIEGHKNGINNMNAKKVFGTSIFLSFVILGALFAINDVYTLFGDFGVFYVFSTFALGVALIVFEYLNKKH